MCSDRNQFFMKPIYTYGKQDKNKNHKCILNQNNKIYQQECDTDLFMWRIELTIKLQTNVMHLFQSSLYINPNNGEPTWTRSYLLNRLLIEIFFKKKIEKLEDDIFVKHSKELYTNFAAMINHCKFNNYFVKG